MGSEAKIKVYKRMRVKQGEPKLDKCSDDNAVDWTKLPDTITLSLFTRLNNCDRASLSSTCHHFRGSGASPCLWRALDIRSHRVGAEAITSLSRRRLSLQKLRFSGAESAASVLLIRATNLQEISGDHCEELGDATLFAMASQYEKLESFQLVPDSCERISSDGITELALRCRNLQRLRLTGIQDISANAINALAQSCTKLIDLGFMDCLSIDEAALQNVTSLQLLSVAGTRNMHWSLALEHWAKLPNLAGLDISRTDVSPHTVNRLLLSSPSLKVLCALHCQAVEHDQYFTSSSNHKGKVLLALYKDILKEVADFIKKEKDGFVDWRNLGIKDKKLDEVMNWLEWVLSHSLIHIIAASNPPNLNHFWLTQGSSILLHLLRSPQEEVQERAATGLATFAVIENENATVDAQRAESVMRDGGIRLLLNLAESWNEGVQKEAAMAIANLSGNLNVAKAVSDEGGIGVLVKLSRSMNNLVAELAACGLRNFSACEDHKSAVVLEGGVQALVNLIPKWLNGDEGVLESAAGALANLAADDKCSMAVASAGGIHVLTTLLCTSKADGVLEQAARALANIAMHEDSSNNAAVGQEAGAIEALLQLTRSSHHGVRIKAARALWNLASEDRNREAIAASGGVEALVTLANSSLNSSLALQASAAGALWELSLSDANSIAIVRAGGVAPLISLARSGSKDVHQTAAAALWNLTLSPNNARYIVEGGGVQALVGLCSTSLSKMARFMAAVTLAFVFDGRMDRVDLVGTSLQGAYKTMSLNRLRRLALEHIEAFILTFADQEAFSAASRSSTLAALAPIMEAVRIDVGDNLIFSEAEIELFVTMLQNPSPVLRGIAAFALVQLTFPGGVDGQRYAGLLHRAGAPSVLRRVAAATTSSMESKVLARIVLRNLEYHETDASLNS